MPLKPTPESLLALAANPPSDEKARKALHDAARQLVFALESPSDTEARISHSYVLYPFVTTVVDLNLFGLLAAAPEKSWRVSQLAETSTADPVLLHRVLRILATQELVDEVDEGTYRASHLTPFLTSPGFVAGVRHNSQCAQKPIAEMPTWLKENGYRNPSGAYDCPFQAGLGTDLDAMGYLMAHPEVAVHTAEYMGYQKVRNKSLTDGSVSIDDFQLSKADVEQGRALLVDVGGGSGHQCIAFRQAFPERAGGLIVQDKKVMIDTVDQQRVQNLALETMVMDFFSSQPVKGAKAYYLRNVLHDWNDERSKIILGHIRAAVMADSVVVLDEMLIPAKGASEKQMIYDVTMMACCGSIERSEMQWRGLGDSVGLRLRDVLIYDEEMQNGLLIFDPT